MKKLGKLLINPEKLMKNEELVNLKGGYDLHWVSCKNGSDTCWSGIVWDCESDAKASCFAFCDAGYTAYVCV
jgi:hypothetical protein